MPDPFKIEFQARTDAVERKVRAVTRKMEER